jgi:threonyl-tRNA synthetase
VLATALVRLRPSTRFATCPATDEGFFYDVHLDGPIEQEDIARLEEEMARVCEEQFPFLVARVGKENAREFFRSIGQSYKVEILDRIADDTVTLYRDGEFLDLCAGPHVPDTGFCRHLKLLNASSAHWRQEEKPSLTRISGTVWESAKELKSYLRFLDEARARDHRVLGPALGLFSTHSWASSPIYHPAGLAVRNGLMALWREVTERQGYIEISSPILYRKELFETSGHWEHFRNDMFVINDAKGGPDWVLKPMNCPDTMLFFKAAQRSYRDLPLRVSEGQLLHRNEPDGSLHGIMRARTFTQDDAHIFLDLEHVQQEILSLLNMVQRVYGHFGLSYNFSLSTRPKDFLGELHVWEEAEMNLRKALDEFGKPYQINEGDGAFYGPKIDVRLTDSLGRKWQCGTVQLDFQLPIRFDLTYAAADGTAKRPIVIHRAIFGSFERFLGVLIEHFAGAFPTWLAPVQAMVLPITGNQAAYAEKVGATLRDRGFRVEVSRGGTINAQVREGQSRKVPFLLVVGEREANDGTVSVRRYRSKESKAVPLVEFVEDLALRVRERLLDVEIRQIDWDFETSAPADVIADY